MPLTIIPLNSRLHDRASFSCGNPQLDRYLQQQANQDTQKHIAAVFVLVDRPNTEILAYYSLSAYTIAIAELNNALAKKLPRYPLLPATLLGRLVVEQKHQGQGYGELMFVNALKKAYSTTEQVASVAVIVEAIDEPALKFYLKYGFQQFQNYPMKFYLPMKSIQSLST